MKRKWLQMETEAGKQKQKFRKRDEKGTECPCPLCPSTGAGAFSIKKIPVSMLCVNSLTPVVHSGGCPSGTLPAGTYWLWVAGACAREDVKSKRGCQRGPPEREVASFGHAICTIQRSWHTGCEHFERAEQEQITRKQDSER